MVTRLVSVASNVHRHYRRNRPTVDETSSATNRRYTQPPTKTNRTATSIPISRYHSIRPNLFSISTSPASLWAGLIVICFTALLALRSPTISGEAVSTVGEIDPKGYTPNANPRLEKQFLRWRVLVCGRIGPLRRSTSRIDFVEQVLRQSVGFAAAWRMRKSCPADAAGRCRAVSPVRLRQFCRKSSGTPAF